METSDLCRLMAKMIGFAIKHGGLTPESSFRSFRERLKMIASLAAVHTQAQTWWPADSEELAQQAASLLLNKDRTLLSQAALELHQRADQIH